MTSDRFKVQLKAIGPGILYAGAAIGASHLVQATRAGASYGFTLVWAILLINLFKYPFFEYGHRFTAATGRSLVQGYSSLGKWAISVFFILSISSGIVNFAAIALLTTSLGAFFFNFSADSVIFSISILSALLIMLFIGKYKLLDISMKILLFVLSIATIAAFFYAIIEGRHYDENFIHPDILNTAGISFLLALMGWMPTPIEASTWPSLWALENNKKNNYKPDFKEYMLDFHIGYITSTILAFFFLGLGAVTMYGTGTVFSNNSAEFSGQLVSLYAGSFGDWSILLISGIAFITIFTTALTVIDGYPRSLEAAFIELNSKGKKYAGKVFWLFALLLTISAAIIIAFFTDRLKIFLDFATITSFLAAPFFAIVNYKVITSKQVPEQMKPKKWLRLLSWIGITFLLGFSLLYISFRIFIQ